MAVRTLTISAADSLAFDRARWKSALSDVANEVVTSVAASMPSCNASCLVTSVSRFLAHS